MRPRRLWIVRHGQSAGNIARDLAESSGAHLVDIALRDLDVPLSPLGVEQSAALGDWMAALPRDARPCQLVASPYIRAVETARIVADRIPELNRADIRLDERLREKEFGILDRMTVHGIAATYPALNAQRAHVGKFYFRPPGGESWCDVVLRLRSWLDAFDRDFAGGSVLVVAHQVVVNCLRYLLEDLTEKQILDIDRAADVPNCAVTMYRHDGHHGWMLEQANFLAPLSEAGTPITTAPDVPAAAKP